MKFKTADNLWSRIINVERELPTSCRAEMSAHLGASFCRAIEFEQTVRAQLYGCRFLVHYTDELTIGSLRITVAERDTSTRRPYSLERPSRVKKSQKETQNVKISTLPWPRFDAYVIMLGSNHPLECASKHICFVPPL